MYCGQLSAVVGGVGGMAGVASALAQLPPVPVMRGLSRERSPNYCWRSRHADAVQSWGSLVSLLDVLGITHSLWSATRLSIGDGEEKRGALPRAGNPRETPTDFGVRNGVAGYRARPNFTRPCRTRCLDSREVYRQTERLRAETSIAGGPVPDKRPTHREIREGEDGNTVPAGRKEFFSAMFSIKDCLSRDRNIHYK